jgi:hypothetical protein
MESALRRALRWGFSKNAATAGVAFKTQASGAAEKAAGKVQNTVGGAKDTAEDWADRYPLSDGERA